MDDDKTWKIVLIDDEADIREVVSIVLEDAGFQISTAPDGESGLALCDRLRPQIVMTDVRMPGMDGIQVLQAVKERYPDMEVIVVTAFGEMELAVKALQLDASDFIAKPIQEDVLLVSLNRAKRRYTEKKDLREYARFLERQMADQAGILHQDKMMSLGRLSASVVHEINNPLFGVLNYVRLMIRILARGDMTAETTRKFQQYLDLVEKETERCSTIVSNLLTFSRKSEPAFGLLKMEELFQRCVLLSQHKLELSNIHLYTRLSPDLPAIKADLNQLQQCLINLIFNAVDAMPEGGNLTLACDPDPEGKKVVITVQDTGTGIQEQDLPHIFEPFFTTKKEGYGVGLGLSTVYGIIEHHKGTVTVTSQPGHTVFMLNLPV